jgi:hypothetical protein
MLPSSFIFFWNLSVWLESLQSWRIRGENVADSVVAEWPRSLRQGIVARMYHGRIATSLQKYHGEIRVILLRK